MLVGNRCDLNISLLDEPSSDDEFVAPIDVPPFSGGSPRVTHLMAESSGGSINTSQQQLSAINSAKENPQKVSRTEREIVVKMESKVVVKQKGRRRISECNDL